MKEIFIICNSPQCLSEISSGKFPGLDQEDLFTSNNAFTFFKTSGKHFNFWIDWQDIFRHVTMPETLSGGYENKVQHIFSRFNMKLANGKTMYRQLHYSPVEQAASSALSALAYTAVMGEYDAAWMIGYTLDESENPIWKHILDRYDLENIHPFVLKFLKK